jgi:hypothetical protein
LNQFFAGASSLMRRRGDPALNFSQRMEELARTLQVWSQAPVQQENQQGDERDNYQVLH